MEAVNNNSKRMRFMLVCLVVCMFFAAVCAGSLWARANGEAVLNKTDLCLEIGEKDTVKIVGGNTPELTSNDPAVAKIEDGNIVAVSVGKTTVNATLDGESAGTVNVEVVEHKKRVDDNICVSVFYPPRFDILDYYDEEEWKRQFRYMQDAEIDLLNSTVGYSLTTNLKYAAYSYAYDMLFSVCTNDFGRNLLSKSETEIYELISQYRNVPGVAGYYLLDEPVNPNEFARVYEYVKKADPNSYPHLNLLPYWYSGYADLTQYKSVANDWVKLNAATGYPQDYLMYDLYPYPAGNGMNRAQFFTNLSTIRQIGLKNNVKTANYIQSVWVGDAAHNTKYRCPTPAEMRYEAMTGLAYGYKQLSYFAWYTPKSNSAESFDKGVILPDGTPNADTYEGVKQLNKEVHALGETLINLDALEVYLNGTETWGQPSIPSGFFAQPTDSKSYIASFMRNQETGRNYLMLVNNDYANSVTVSVRLDSALAGLTRISSVDGTRGAVSLGANNVLTVNLAAGDGALYELPEGYDYYTPPTAKAGENLAQRANIGANSSTGNGYHYIDKMIDGERKSSGATRTNGWRSTGTVTEESPAVITFDFGFTSDVNRMDLYPYGPKATYGEGFPEDFTVEVSSDGVNYTTALTQTGYELTGINMSGRIGLAKGQKFTLDAADVRYMRITVTKANGDGYAALAEIEIYNDDGSVPDVEQFELIDTGVGQAGDGAHYDSRGWYNGNLGIDGYLSYVQAGDYSIIGSYAENKVINSTLFPITSDEVQTVSFEWGIEYEGGQSTAGHRFLYFVDTNDINGYRDFTYDSELMPLAFFINKTTHEMQVFVCGQQQELSNGQATVMLGKEKSRVRFINQNRTFYYHYITVSFDYSQTKFNQPAYVTVNVDGNEIVKAEIASDAFSSGNMQMVAQFWGGGGSPYVEFSSFGAFLPVSSSVGDEIIAAPMKIMSLEDDVKILLSKPATSVRLTNAAGQLVTLTEGEQYTLDGNAVIIDKEYLQGQPIGYFANNTVFNFTASGGATTSATVQLLYHNPPEYSQNGVLTVKEELTADVTFDVAYERDEEYGMKLDGAALSADSYTATFDGANEKIHVTIKKECINALAHGSHTFTLSTTGGAVVYEVYRNLHANEWVIATRGSGYGSYNTGVAYNANGTATLSFLPLSRIYYTENLDTSKTIYFGLEAVYGQYSKESGWLAIGLVNDIAKVGSITENNDDDRFVFLYAPDSGRFQVIGVKGTSKSGAAYRNSTGMQVFAITLTADGAEIRFNGHTVFTTTERSLDNFEDGCYMSLFFSATVFSANVPAEIGAPIVATKGRTYTAGSATDLALELYNATSVTSVTCNGETLTSDDYAYSGGVFTVRGSYLKSLKADEKLDFTLTCPNGSTGFTVAVQDGSGVTDIEYDQNGWADVRGGSVYTYADGRLTVLGGAGLMHRDGVDTTAAGGVSYTLNITNINGYYKMGQAGSVDAYIAVSLYDEQSGNTVTLRVYSNDSEKSGNYLGYLVLTLRDGYGSKVYVGDNEVRDAASYLDASVFGEHKLTFTFADGTLAVEWDDEVLYLDTGDTTHMDSLRLGLSSTADIGNSQNAFMIEKRAAENTPPAGNQDGDNQSGDNQGGTTEPAERKCGCGSEMSPASATFAALACMAILGLCALAARRRKGMRG